MNVTTGICLYLYNGYRERSNTLSCMFFWSFNDSNNYVYNNYVYHITILYRQSRYICKWGIIFNYALFINLFWEGEGWKDAWGSASVAPIYLSLHIK